MWSVVTRLGGRCGAIALLLVALAPATPARASLGTDFGSQANETTRNRTADLVWGKGSKGPYPLSCRPVIPGSVSVRVDGAHELLPAEYQIDFGAGTITFATALAKDHIARVEYAHNPAGAGANPAALKGPVSLELAQMQVGSGVNSTLKLSSAWRPPDRGGAAVTAVGMGVDTSIGSHTKISSLLAITPASARPAGAGGGDASAVQIGAQTETQRGKARVSYLRTGDAFGAASDYQWQPDVEKLDVSGSYALSGRVSLQSSYVRTDQNNSGNKPTRTTALLANALTASLSPLSRLTIRRSEEQVTAADAPDQTKVSNAVQLDQQLGMAGSAQLRHEVTVADNGTAEQTTETTGMKLDARVTEGARVVAERVQVRSGAEDPAVQTQVAVTAGVPDGRVKLQGEYSAREQPGQAAQEVQGATVEATPLGGLKIAGGIRQTQTGEETQLQKHAAVEVQAPAGIRVAGSYQEQTDGAGNTLQQVRAVDASVKPIQGLEMSGTYKERETGEQAGPLTRGLRINIAPWKYLQLNGGIVQNPEEQGKVLQERRRTLGVRSELGRVSLTGDLAQRYDLSARPLADEMQVGVTLQLTRFDRVFTTYKLAEESAATTTTNYYTFGYSRRVANALNLSLEGEYLRRAQGSQVLDDQTEARARASLDVRF